MFERVNGERGESVVNSNCEQFTNVTSLIPEKSLIALYMVDSGDPSRCMKKYQSRL